MAEHASSVSWLTAASSVTILLAAATIVAWQLLGSAGKAHPATAVAQPAAPTVASAAGVAPPAPATARVPHLTVWLVSSLAEAARLRAAFASINELPANQVVVALSEEDTARATTGLPEPTVIDLRSPVVYLVASDEQARQVQPALLAASRLSVRDDLIVAASDAEAALRQGAVDLENGERIAAGLAPQVLVDLRPVGALARLLEP